MTTSSSPRDSLRIRDVQVTADRLTFDLVDGRMISVPLDWFPRLAAGTPAQRANWRFCGGGFGVHWPDLDEDISAEGMLYGAPLTPRRGAA